MAGYATHVSQQHCLMFKSELFNEAINYICYIFGIQSMYEDQEQAIRAFLMAMISSSVQPQDMESHSFSKVFHLSPIIYKNSALA